MLVVLFVARERVQEVDRCSDDPLVRTPKAKLVRYWGGRLPEITASVSRYAVTPMQRKETVEVLKSIADNGGDDDGPHA
jgi:hypothetical protein